MKTNKQIMMRVTYHLALQDKLPQENEDKQTNNDEDDLSLSPTESITLPQENEEKQTNNDEDDLSLSPTESIPESNEIDDLNLTLESMKFKKVKNQTMKKL